MHIVIYREYEEIMASAYSYLLDMLSKYRKLNETTFSSMRIKHIKIDFWSGDINKMSGLAVDYFETDSIEASKFLKHRAARNNGRELADIEEVVKIIEDELKTVYEVDVDHGDTYRETLVKQVKALGEEIIDQAENLVGTKDLYTGFEIKLIFPQKTDEINFPTIEVKSTHVSRIIKERDIL